jgi:hypothetical protein
MHASMDGARGEGGIVGVLSIGPKYYHVGDILTVVGSRTRAPKFRFFRRNNVFSHSIYRSAGQGDI